IIPYLTISCRSRLHWSRTFTTYIITCIVISKYYWLFYELWMYQYSLNYHIILNPIIDICILGSIQNNFLSHFPVLLLLLNIVFAFIKKYDGICPIFIFITIPGTSYICFFYCSIFIYRNGY